MKAAKLTVVAIPIFTLDEAAPVSVVTFFAPVAWAFEPIRGVPVVLVVPVDVLPDPVLEAAPGVEAAVRDRRLVSDVLRIAPLIWAEASGESWPVIPVRLFKEDREFRKDGAIGQNHGWKRVESK